MWQGDAIIWVDIAIPIVITMISVGFTFLIQTLCNKRKYLKHSIKEYESVLYVINTKIENIEKCSMLDFIKMIKMNKNITDKIEIGQKQLYNNVLFYNDNFINRSQLNKLFDFYCNIRSIYTIIDKKMISDINKYYNIDRISRIENMNYFDVYRNDDKNSKEIEYHFSKSFCFMTKKIKLKKLINKIKLKENSSC